MTALYRAQYRKPSGDTSHVTFSSPPSDALRWAGDYVRCCIGGELLELAEVRPADRPVVQLTLV